MTRTRLVMSTAICLFAVAVATAGFPRRGDVAGTSHAPDVRVLGALGLVMLVGSILLMTFGPKRGAGRPAPRSIWPYLVGQAFLLVVLFYVLRDTHFADSLFSGLHQTNSRSGDGTAGPQLARPDVSVWPVLASVALLVGLLALWWLTRRVVAEDLPVDDPEVDPDVIAAAATAGLSALEPISAGREAVIRCYEAMTSAIGSRGIHRRAADTPTDLLERAVEARVLEPGPPEELIGLFQIARYSHQPLADDAVPRAVAALRLIQADVGAAMGAHR